MKPSSYLINREPREKLDDALHDLTNALAAVRSYSEVLRLRIGTDGKVDPGLLERLLAETDRAGAIVKDLRRETYRQGDLLACVSCGYVFVHRRRQGKAPACRRCKSAEVDRWKPAD